MQKDEVLQMSRSLHALYDERFPSLNTAEADLWLEALRHLDGELVRAGVRRWYHQHRLKAPSLNELLEQVECVREDQKRSTASNRSTTVLQVATPATILQDAANHIGNDWARLHVELFTKITQHASAPHPAVRYTAMTFEQQSLYNQQLQIEARARERRRTQEAAALCESFATQYPKDAQAWQHEAAWWRASCPQSAPSRCVTIPQRTHAAKDTLLAPDLQHAAAGDDTSWLEEED